MSSSGAHSSQWHLSALQTAELPASVPIRADGFVIGRASICDLVIPATVFPGVSGQHAQLRIVEDELLLADLDSRNGTWVGGQKVREVRLEHGDVFQLGPDGPRFMAVSSADLDRTATIEAPVFLPEEKPRVGDETMELVREKLGLEKNTGVQELVREGTRTANRTSRVVVAVLLLVVAAGAWFWFDQDRAARERSEEIGQLRAALDSAKNEVEAQQRRWERREREVDRARLAWDKQKRALEDEQNRLNESIQKLVAEGRAAGTELESLQIKLETTSAQLRMYDPISLEQDRLARVSRVERAVVLIEARELMRESKSGKVLYYDPQARLTGDDVFNFEDRGEPFSREGTGSGFCFSSEGWIFTNAHVVFKKEDEEWSLSLGPDIELQPEVELKAVFSGDSARHPAQLVSWESDGNQDLALLKIEPFEDMPHLQPQELDFEVNPPARGTDVYLLGFPLGKRVLHEGDTMIASAFRGIVSRKVDYYLQVDAAVHPGNSGGPVLDGQGKIIGVVVGMQALDPTAESSAIGYIIPIAEAARLWPPPTPTPSG